MEPFSRVKVSAKQGVFEGMLLPSDKVALKLDSGYNVLFEDAQVELIAPPVVRTFPKQVSRKVSGKRIVIVHTGGTIASKVDYHTGAVHPAYSSDEIVAMYPELASIMPVVTVQVANILSEDLRFSHLNALASKVRELDEDDDVAGIIVTHGTDTMHYSASAITFMVSARKPIIFTGSQRSSDRPSADARLNLLSAAFAIEQGAASGVYVCMHGSIMNQSCVLIEGIAARKEHSSRRDAFVSINREVCAHIDLEKRIFEQVRVPQTHAPHDVLLFDESVKVGILTSHPNMVPEEIRAYALFDALIIQGTGFGHIGVSPDIPENAALFEAVRDVARAIPMFMTKQTIRGITNLGVYSAGRRLREAGVLGDMTDCTMECAFVKIALLVSARNAQALKDAYGSDDARILMMRSLKGEYGEVRGV